MISKKYSAVFFGIMMIMMISCESWLDVNDDPNSPSEVSIELVLPTGISSVAWVVGGRYQVLGALWSQHWTQSLGASQYSSIDSYDIISSDFDDREFGELYSGALNDLEFVRKEALKQESWNYFLIATVMQAYTFQILADLYGEIPFSEALKGQDDNITPVYEDGQAVYDSLISRLDYALTRDFEKEDLPEPGKEDIIFDGDMDQWIAFANTLKLKIFIRQSEARPEVARKGVEMLYADEDIEFLETYAVMTNFIDEAGKRNPLYATEIIFLGDNPNLVISNTLLSFMTENGDLDRLDAMFNFPDAGGGHKGLVQGNYNDPDEPAGTNSNSYSKPVFDPNYPVFLMMLSESLLLQAEAIIRYDVDSYSEAKKKYNDAIEASFYLYGFSNAENFYGPGQIYAFPAEGSPPERFIEAIIVQKWICLANFQSLETFFEHNRTHYPKESPVPGDDQDYEAGEFTVSVNNVTSGRFPRRLLFPESEYARNPNTPPRKEVWEKIWWDVKEEEQ